MLNNQKKHTRVTTTIRYRKDLFYIYGKSILIDRRKALINEVD